MNLNLLYIHEMNTRRKLKSLSYYIITIYIYINCKIYLLKIIKITGKTSVNANIIFINSYKFKLVIR